MRRLRRRYGDAYTLNLPVIGTMTEKDGAATAYVCENYACQLPTADPKKFAELLQAP